MATTLDEATLDFLLAQSGLTLTPAQKAELLSVYPALAAMKALVRTPRGHMAEPSSIYAFAAEDLA
jgi:hypothetical protein